MHDTGEVTSAVATATVRRTVRWYSVALCAGAVAVGGVLVALGAPVPTLGPILLLALAAALCVNRFALFTSEHAATAEAAVVLAAVVGFRSEAAYLGPLVVGLLVGPLDALHWEQHSFVRMAYNAGNRGWSALAAAGVFAGVQEVVGTSTAAWVLAVAASAVAFTLVDETLSVVLLRLHGERLRASVLHVFDVDLLALPFALVGAAAGILAGEVGWWATVLALLPIALAPELLLARARARATSMRDLAALLSAIAILATVALVTPVAATASLAILCVLAVLLGIELAPGRRALVPPLVALVVIPACVLLDGDRLRVGAVIVALVTTATSWWCERTVSRVRVVAALAVATGAAVVAAQLAVELPRTADGLALNVLTAGVAFELLTLAVAPARSRRGVALAWMVPLLGVAVAGALWWRTAGDTGGIVLAAFVATALLAWSGWGAPAWSSRIARRAASAMSSPWWLAFLALAVAAALVATVIGGAVRDHSLAAAWAWTGAGFGEVAIAMTAAGVRQWRLAPWPRRRGFVVTAAGAVLLVGLGAPLAARGSAWGAVVVAATMVVVLLTARAPARRLREVAVATDDHVRAR